ncbi:DUF4097 family beta strand repeat-containing protein [Cellulomonas sp. S1-8]|uniref:DUF4097 family beta strand repeat-containing protein n=1 Tax=Cellulomonas sp. S1-8 TaxID=2904790 RepID=UPI0022432D14|nr:DUF4097 family beta strand repeat-containing protein [Cellulomonas sp. S1-8]UZN02820.1 DUF4097 family beta strand repeat-containing protein [Cellulomonas sp. S1-8]
MIDTQPTHPPAAAAPGAPRARRSTAGRVLTGVGVTLAVVVLAQGAVQLAAWMFTTTSSASATLEPTDVVELVADGGVEVVAADVDEVVVGRVAEYAWSSPRYEVTTTGDRTVVRHECRILLVSLPCTASLTAEVPEGTHVVIRATDGTIRVQGAAGDVELRTADGEVSVDGVAGDVDLRSVDGRVTVDGVGGDVVVQVSDGELRVVDAGGDVRVRAVDGAVSVAGVAGDVDVRSSDGRLDVRDVRGSLVAQTVDGNVRVAGVGGDVGVRAVDAGITVHGDGEPVALTITTNGRQRVEGPTDPDADVRVELVSVDGDIAYLGPEG